MTDKTRDSVVLAWLLGVSVAIGLGAGAIVYLVHDVTTYGITTHQRSQTPAEIEEESSEYERYVEGHRPDAYMADAGPMLAYPDGGMDPAVYIETCRQLCESNRDHLSAIDHRDDVGQGVPHVIEVDPRLGRCVCWRPDEYWGNHVETYHNWQRWYPRD